MRRRYFWWLGLAAGAVVVGWLALAPEVFEVETVAVSRGAMRVTIDEEGETRLRRRFVVSAPVSGRVLRIDTRPGDRVKAGQALAVIQPAAPPPLDARTQATAEARARAADAAVTRATAERDQWQVQAVQAEADAARAKALLESGFGAREAFEQLDARARSLRQAIASADAAIRAAEFERAAARAALIARDDAAGGRAVTVAAPIGGLILRRVQESETVVPAGAPLLELGNLDDLEIVADLLSTDAVRVSPGAAVLIERWGGDRALSGRVQRVEPSGFMKISALGVEERRVNVIIDFDEPREARASLGDGFRVEIRVVVWERPDVVTVPTSSLFRSDGAWAVFLVDGDTLVRREVAIGQRNEQVGEVLSGLAPGDRVVAYPGESLQAGARVRSR